MAANNAEQKKEGFCSCLFPCEPFACFGGLCCCLPPTWQKIQDFTHFSLVIGVFSGILLVVRSGIHIYDQTCISEDEFWCVREGILIFFTLTVIIYIGSIISQYDEQLMDKERKVKEQKQLLLASYGDLLQDMDGLLTSATESASGLAERSFESKRRDFQRFLDRAKSRFSAVDSPNGEMLTQFRQFCLNWLSVFQECSIDPVARPLNVVSHDELMNCNSISEVVDMCLDRLRVTEVRFISHQQEEDKKKLSRNKKDLESVQKQKSPNAAKILAITAGGEAGPAAGDMGMAASFNVAAQNENKVTWLKCCKGGEGCGYESHGTGGDPFPRSCAFGCGKLVCLSKQHTMLLMAFFFGIVVLAVDIYDILDEPEGTPVNAIRLAIAWEVFMVLLLWTITVLLLNFESLDVVQKLEREVSALKEHNEQVEKQSKVMKEFWNNAQNLTELWLYRTVPRLDLYKELHSQLEDEEEEDLLSRMKVANVALQDLESKLGALEAWRGDGDLKTEDKKMFGKTVNELCQTGQLDTMLKQLQDNVIHGAVMKPLKALPQAPHNR